MLANLYRPTCYSVAGICLACTALLTFWRTWTVKSTLHTIPTVGYSTGSYFASIRNLMDMTSLIEQGYYKYKNSLFKLQTLRGWIIFVSGSNHVGEVAKAPASHLSGKFGLIDFLDLERTIGHAPAHDPYHIDFIQTRTTRDLAIMFPMIKDVIAETFSDVLGAVDPDEWKSIPAHEIVYRMVSRISSSVFIGLSLCRNQDWLDLCVRFSSNVLRTGAFLGLLPGFLRPLVAEFIFPASLRTREAAHFLEPIINERREQLAHSGAERHQINIQSDLIGWLISEDKERTTWMLSQRVMSVLFASMEGVTQGIVHGLFNLAAHPEYARPLREEVEALVQQEGWTKNALDRMWKMDSFLKECHCLSTSPVILVRKVLQDFTFSDGRIVPSGCYVAVPGQAIHQDDAVYDSARSFQPFRFFRLREDQCSNVERLGMTATSHTFLTFGYGNHACRGRFFGAMAEKAILAYLVHTYDVSFGDAPPPKHKFFNLVPVVDLSVKIRFRKRSD